MISDVLSDALDEIERYQREFADCYDELRDRIEPVKQAMRDLMNYLDTPPDLPMDLIKDYRQAYEHHVKVNREAECDPGTFAEFVEHMQEQDRLCNE